MNWTEQLTTPLEGVKSMTDLWFAGAMILSICGLALFVFVLYTHFYKPQSSQSNTQEKGGRK